LNEGEKQMKKQSLIILCLAIAWAFFNPCLPCQAQQELWVCPDDDAVNGVYWTCNYFPLNPGNRWQYTTGEYHVVNDIRQCASGYYGILYETAVYEFSSYIQNGKDGFVFAGCQYDEGILEDFGEKMVFIPPQMIIGESARSSILNSILDVTLVGLEAVTVPAGTFETLKVELRIQDIGTCSYKTTLWLAKDIGPVKIHRTEANPSSCMGCVFVCVKDDDRIRLNTAAELISFTVDPNAGFADIPFGYWAYDYIMGIYDANVTTGCSQAPLMYCPENTVTREQMAVFITRALNQVPADGYCGTTNPFPDVAFDRWSCKNIRKLYELGITTGYQDGRFGPDDPVTREQMAVFITKALAAVPPDGYCGITNPFTDVPFDRWSCEFVKKLAEMEITTGYGDGRFGPEDYVTRAQMAVFLSRAFLGM
jgi:hypothetical protein